MAATHQFSESNLVGEVETIPAVNLNFGSVDASAIIPATNPIIRGNASFEKYIRAKFTGTFTEISNIKFWKSLGAYVIDEAIKAVANVAYATPSQIPNADLDVPITEGTALAIQAADGSITITPPEDYTKYIRLQTRSTVSTPTGAGNQKVFTFQYDEI